MTENDDRMGSTWEVGDLIYVKFEGQDEVGTLRVTDATTGAVEVVDNQLYWTSPSATIIAWHTSSGEPDKMDVSDQTGDIAYVVGCKTQVNFEETVNLSLSHQLSKVRVLLDGFTEPTGVTMEYPAAYTISDGKLTASAADGTIAMYPTTVNGKTCYEATVIPGTLAPSNTFVVTQADGAKLEMGLDIDLTLEAGKTSEARLYIIGESSWIDLATLTEPYVINDDGPYYFTGTGNQPLQVKGGNPDVYLKNATITCPNSPFSIEGGSNTTIHVMGNDTLRVVIGEYLSRGAGIFVADGSTVTIVGNSRNDVLHAIGGQGCGIGGCWEKVPSASSLLNPNKGLAAGNIIIKNVTVYALDYWEIYGWQDSSSAGIGSSCGNKMGTITIDNATVYAWGNGFAVYGDSWDCCPAIGQSCYWRNFSSNPPKNPLSTIVISNSEIHAHRYGTKQPYASPDPPADTYTSYCDYIGMRGFYNTTNEEYQGQLLIQFGPDGKCTNSTIYCYTCGTGESVAPDCVFVYDANGNRTEQ